MRVARRVCPQRCVSMQSWSHQWCDLDVTGLTKTFILDIRTSKAEFSYILPVALTRDVVAAGSPQVAHRPGLYWLGTRLPAFSVLWFYW